MLAGASKLTGMFRKSFEGVRYRYRVSNTGDRVAAFLYDDLLTLAESEKIQGQPADGTRIGV